MRKKKGEAVRVHLDMLTLHEGASWPGAWERFVNMNIPTYINSTRDKILPRDPRNLLAIQGTYGDSSLGC